jgi:hypothetical protein
MLRLGNPRRAGSERIARRIARAAKSALSFVFMVCALCVLGMAADLDVEGESSP